MDRGCFFVFFSMNTLTVTLQRRLTFVWIEREAAFARITSRKCESAKNQRETKLASVDGERLINFPSFLHLMFTDGNENDT